jgi:hypothetical protein
MTMTNTPPPEIQNVIEAHVNGFNPHDNALSAASSGDTAVMGPHIVTCMRFPWMTLQRPVARAKQRCQRARNNGLSMTSRSMSGHSTFISGRASS